MVLYTCLFSVVSLCYIFISEDLELGATYEKAHVAFVFLGLGYLVQYLHLRATMESSGFHQRLDLANPISNGIKG